MNPRWITKYAAFSISPIEKTKSINSGISIGNERVICTEYNDSSYPHLEPQQIPPINTRAHEPEHAIDRIDRAHDRVEGQKGPVVGRQITIAMHGRQGHMQVVILVVDRLGVQYKQERTVAPRPRYTFKVLMLMRRHLCHIGNVTLFSQHIRTVPVNNRIRLIKMSNLINLNPKIWIKLSHTFSVMTGRFSLDFKIILEHLKLIMNNWFCFGFYINVNESEVLLAHIFSQIGSDVFDLGYVLGDNVGLAVDLLEELLGLVARVQELVNAFGEAQQPADPHTSLGLAIYLTKLYFSTMCGLFWVWTLTFDHKLGLVVVASIRNGQDWVGL